MGFLYSFIGAVLGALVGITAAFFSVAALSDGNDIGDGFAFLGLAPIGLVMGVILGILLALKLRRYVRINWCIKSARRKTAVIVAGSILAVPGSIAVMVWGQQELRKPPPDQQLLSNFTSSF